MVRIWFLISGITLETAYKVFRREIIQNINLKQNRFDVELEMIAKVARLPAIRIYEVVILNIINYEQVRKLQ
jgi:hypothetical protein